MCDRHAGLNVDKHTHTHRGGAPSRSCTPGLIWVDVLVVILKHVCSPGAAPLAGFIWPVKQGHTVSSPLTCVYVCVCAFQCTCTHVFACMSHALCAVKNSDGLFTVPSTRRQSSRAGRFYASVFQCQLELDSNSTNTSFTACTAVSPQTDGIPTLIDFG